MRRALVVLALASTGCMFHVWRAKHAPGIVELEQPPQPLTHVETPKDPGKTSDVVYGSFGMGGFLQRGGGGLALDTEVGIWLQLESDRSDRATIADAPLRGSFSRKMPALGTAFGFTFYRELRGSDNALFGPIHYEVRTALPFSSTGSFGVARFGLGAAFNPQNLGFGPQTSVCVSAHPALGALCARGAWMFGGDGPEMYVYYEVSSLLEISLSR